MLKMWEKNIRISPDPPRKLFSNQSRGLRVMLLTNRQMKKHKNITFMVEVIINQIDFPSALQSSIALYSSVFSSLFKLPYIFDSMSLFP